MVHLSYFFSTSPSHQVHCPPKTLVNKHNQLILPFSSYINEMNINPDMISIIKYPIKL